MNRAWRRHGRAAHARCRGPATHAPALLVLALLFGAARTTRAAELEVHGPPECADAAELSFRIERSLGTPLASAAPLSFDVVMQRGSSSYVARIRLLHGGSGNAAKERVLSAGDCGKLTDAVSVAIALALGEAESGEPAWDVEDTSAATPESVAPPAAPAPAAAAPPVPASSDDENGDEPSVGWVPSLSAWLIADAGSLPAPSLGAALGAELVMGRLTVRALGTLLFEQHTTVASAQVPAPGADLQLLAGSLLACTAPLGAPRKGLVSLACLGVEVGRLAGVGTNVADPRSGSALWVAPRLDAGAAWVPPGSALRLSATVTAAVPLNRDEFALTGIGTAYQPPNIIGRLSLGAGVVF
jgi:hypothetical protein